MARNVRTGSVVSLVPARGGSKGLPGKNIRPLAGHPLIAWAIAAGKASAAAGRVFCSTDSVEIAEVAASYGAEVPFMRPAEFATDSATDLDVFRHFLNWLAEEEGEIPEFVVQLRPTTPFRASEWIDEAVGLMQAQPGISCVRTITPAPQTPYKMWVSDADRMLRPLLHLEGVAEPFNASRQSLPVVFWHTGQLDVIRAETILDGSMTGPAIYGLEVDGRLAVDIDDIRDFKLAEMILRDTMPANILSTIKALADAGAAAE